MRTHLLAALAGLTSLTAMADYITPDQALARIAGEPVKTLSTIRQAEPKLIHTEKADNLATVYVFSTAGKGLLLLSADDQAEAVLGYTDNATDEEMNPTLRAWINEYSKEIDWLRNNATVRKLPTATSAKEYAAVAPLLKTKWNQNAPYNNMCPTVGDQHCMTGCAATALAQVVNWHRLPAEKGKGTSSYTWNNQTLSFDFAAESFDWDNMLNEYTSTATQAQKDAVAKLMYACGVALDMSYGVNSSGGYPGTAIPDLINNFGYDQSLYLAERKYYTLPEWIDLIYNQIIDCGPVDLSGFNDAAGHSFVCDGYSSDGYFHINWGWGGASDGYFRLSALNPSSQGIGGSADGYSGDQYILANLMAPREGSKPYASMVVYNELGVDSKSCAVGSYTYITGGFFNMGSTSISGEIGYYIINTETGDSTYYTSTNFNDLPVRYGYSQYPVFVPSDIAEGNYRIVPAWKYDGVVRAMARSINSPQYIDMKVEGTTAYFSVNNSVRIEVSDVSLDTPFFIGKEVDFSGTLKNISELEYEGKIFGAVLSADGTSHIASGLNFYVDVLSGDSTPIKYTSTFTAVEGQTLTAGSYLFVFADQNGNVISDPINIEVQNAPTMQGTINVSDFRFIGDSNNANADDLNFSMKVNCTSGYFIGKVSVYIFPESGGSSSMGMHSGNLYIDAGNSETVTFNGSFPLTKGARYIAAAFNGLNQLGYDYVRFTVGANSGIETVENDADVISTEVYTVDGVKVSNGELNPGLYIVVEHLIDGTVRTTKQMFRK